MTTDLTRMLAQADPAAAGCPVWCEGFSDPRHCLVVDQEYDELHCHGAQVGAIDRRRNDIEVVVDLYRAIRHGAPDGPYAEIVIPGGQADLDRPQLRRLIAVLTHIDNLWDL